MAVGTALMVASAGATAYSAFNQMKAGKQQAKSLTQQGEFNAQVYEQQAGMILEQKKLSDYQYHRQAAKLRGGVISRTAGAGLNFSGSPVAIAIDNESQMLLDKAVNDYNLDVQANYARSGAIYQKETASQQSKLAKSTGNSNAFTTLLNFGTQLGMNYVGARAGKL